MAASCSGVIRSAMPSGRSKTGLKIPNTAGSRRVGEHTTRTEAACGGNCIGSSDASAMARRTRYHDLAQKETQTATPHNQTEIKTKGSNSPLDAAAARMG